MERKRELNTGESGIRSVDPTVMMMDVAKRWLVILTAALIVGVGAYIWADATYTPVYRTTTTFVVTSHSSSSTVYSNLTTANSLATVFSELLNSSLLRKSILAEIGETSFSGSIDSAVIPGTNLLTMNVTAADPRTAFLVARAIIDHHEAVTYQIVDNISLEVLQFPTIPVVPSNSDHPGSTMKKAMILSAVAACGILAAAPYLHNTVRNGTEAAQKLECDYLGDIPHERKYKTFLSRLRRRKTGILITVPLTGFRFIESVRKLRHRVIQRMRGSKVLMVASVMENEGKSTIAVNLALSMAQNHARVLLIDCDLRKPACHMLLEQRQPKHTLGEVLTGKADVRDAIARYQNTNLYMLLENHHYGSTGKLIASQNMKSLIAWARNEFDYVVLDLPPMAVASDAERMMEIADASLLVIQQNTAAVPGINKAIASLKSGNAKLLGCVLNNVYTPDSFHIQSYGHGYGYGYGYGRYGKYGRYGRYGGYGHYGYKSRK